MTADCPCPRRTTVRFGPGGVLVRLEEPFARPVFDLPGRYGAGAS